MYILLKKYAFLLNISLNILYICVWEPHVTKYVVCKY